MFTGRNIVQGDEIEEFWALKDINFEIHEGDRVGVIGRNGAGKSTLLKVLSRITEPTTGRIIINGRVASLLEVGTGFHPELSGRENVYLNGAILGMSRGEVRQKFDEIVDFAGVEKFLDTPVKRYSSGMYVRLAFAVAAHLDPEILIVDEVLAVGDADFQRKCLGKMESFGKDGRTVLFVSHSMNAVTSLCNKCLLVEKGNIKRQGTPSDVIVDYLGGGQSEQRGRVDFHDIRHRIGDEYVELLYGEIVDAQGKPAAEIDICKPVSIRMGFRVLKNTSIPLVPNFHFVRPDGTYAFVSSLEEFNEFASGDYVATCEIPGDFLNEGIYFVGLAVSSFAGGKKAHFYEPSALMMNVKDSLEGSVGRASGYVNEVPGVVRPRFSWTVVKAKV
jgi:lipopolysaccharide transport system ATP-binding protein